MDHGRQRQAAWLAPSRDRGRRGVEVRAGARRHACVTDDTHRRRGRRRLPHTDRGTRSILRLTRLRRDRWGRAIRVPPPQHVHHNGPFVLAPGAQSLRRPRRTIPASPPGHADDKRGCAADEKSAALSSRSRDRATRAYGLAEMCVSGPRRPSPELGREYARRALGCKSSDNSIACRSCVAWCAGIVVGAGSTPQPIARGTLERVPPRPRRDEPDRGAGSPPAEATNAARSPPPTLPTMTAGSRPASPFALTAAAFAAGLALGRGRRRDQDRARDGGACRASAGTRPPPPPSADSRGVTIHRRRARRRRLRLRPGPRRRTVAVAPQPSPWPQRTLRSWRAEVATAARGGGTGRSPPPRRAIAAARPPDR